MWLGKPAANGAGDVKMTSVWLLGWRVLPGSPVGESAECQEGIHIFGGFPKIGVPPNLCISRWDCPFQTIHFGVSPLMDPVSSYFHRWNPRTWCRGIWTKTPADLRRWFDDCSSFSSKVAVAEPLHVSRPPSGADTLLPVGPDLVESRCGHLVMGTADFQNRSWDQTRLVGVALIDMYIIYIYIQRERDIYISFHSK